VTPREQALVAALEHTERIAEQTLETMAALTLCRLEAAVHATTLATGDVLLLEPTRVVAVAEWRLFDTLIAQLKEAKAAATELTRQLTADPEAPGTWDMKAASPSTAPHSAPTAPTPRRLPNGRRRKPDTTT
jgi:hypothetical protein